MLFDKSNSYYFEKKVVPILRAEPHCLVGSVRDLRTGCRWFDPLARPTYFPKIDDSHCDRIHSSLTAVHCFDDGYVGKQPVACEEYFAKHWLKELKESMDRCIGCCGITEILLETALNTIQPINAFLSLTCRICHELTVEIKFY